MSTPGGFEGIDLDQLRRMFMAEAREMSAALETGALSRERSPGDAEVINDVFRSAHTLKGAAATIGLSQSARTIAQDAASCVVFGMPRAAIERGAAQEILALDAIAAALGVAS